MDADSGFGRLVAIMDRLRGPDGCPWDHEQTYASLRRYLLEECYEVADALDRDDGDDLREELGDLLFQIVFLSRLAKEDGRFTIDAVVEGISRKMVRRHPHVFGDGSASTAEEVHRNWDRIKRTEAPKDSALDGVPPALPALLKALQYGERAARSGFDWDSADGVLEQLACESAELREALGSGDADRVEDELGDVLFTTVMLARRVGLDPERALERSNRKFQRRFQAVERELARDGSSPGEVGSERLERLWRDVKRQERDSG